MRPADHDAARAVRLVRAVPDHLRRFTASDEVARTVHAVGPGVMSELRRHGFPSWGDPPGYDPIDLANASLHLGLEGAHRLAMSRWPGAIAAGTNGQPVRYRVDLALVCPSPRVEHSCAWTVDPRLLEVLGIDGPVPSAGTAAGRAAVGGTTVGIRSAAARRALRDQADLTFALLPAGLGDDVDFARRTGLANCSLAARVLHADLQAVGVTARLRTGLVVGPPFSFPHTWVELEQDGEWLPVDPFLLAVLDRFGFVVPSPLAVDRSVGGAYRPVAGDSARLVTHHPGWAVPHVSLRTSRAPETAVPAAADDDVPPAPPRPHQTVPAPEEHP